MVQITQNRAPQDDIVMKREDQAKLLVTFVHKGIIAVEITYLKHANLVDTPSTLVQQMKQRVPYANQGHFVQVK